MGRIGHHSQSKFLTIHSLHLLVRFFSSILIAFIGSAGFLHQPGKYVLTGHAQGTTWSISYYASDSLVTKGEIDSILVSLDSSLSLYKPYSLINQFNKAKKELRMDRHLANVVRKSLDIYANSNGIFDITVQPLVEAWGFSAGKTDHFPDSAEVRKILQCVGSDQLEISDGMLVKKKPCIRIDLDGIAQGYSVDVLADFLGDKSISDFIVELGGEIRVKGRRRPGNEKMKIGIEAPGDYEFEPSVLQKIIYLDSRAVTTSGNYRKFHESNGKKFSHTIDPHTGYPTQNELISVTVIAADAITADAYDNVLMVMGLRQGLKIVEQRKDLAAYFIYRNSHGGISDSASSRFKVFFQP